MHSDDFYFGGEENPAPLNALQELRLLYVSDDDDDIIEDASQGPCRRSNTPVDEAEIVDPYADYSAEPKDLFSVEIEKAAEEEILEEVGVEGVIRIQGLLLESQVALVDFLDRPTVVSLTSASADMFKTGETEGRWQLLRELGEAERTVEAFELFDSNIFYLLNIFRHWCGDISQHSQAITAFSVLRAIHCFLVEYQYHGLPPILKELIDTVLAEHKAHLLLTEVEALKDREYYSWRRPSVEDRAAMWNQKLASQNQPKEVLRDLVSQVAKDDSPSVQGLKRPRTTTITVVDRPRLTWKRPAMDPFAPCSSSRLDDFDQIDWARLEQRESTHTEDEDDMPKLEKYGEEPQGEDAQP